MIQKSKNKNMKLNTVQKWIVAQAKNTLQEITKYLT